MAKKKRNYRAEEAHRRNLEQARIREQNARQKAFWQANGKKILIIADSFDEMTKRAGRNVAEVLLMSAAEVNVEQLLDARKVVIVDSAMEIIANRTK